MTVHAILKHLQLSATFVSTAILIGACGEPLADEEEDLSISNNTVTALNIYPPAATMSCSRYSQTSTFSCSGNASNGVAPYTYQWQEVDDFGGGSTSTYWYNGTTSRNGECQWGLYTYGTYYTKYVRFRVIDANTYVSNVVERRINCWIPTE
ncbi:hypothetical protein HV824_10590 [Myxococcus sp. AM009]|uniref:hypothetical protein n=1 Tax=unclassified Myxococcus TaxID=2648731 RepID=UPI001595BC7C|nr:MULTISPECIES: hypothetical protein [unclassified Myxococcus]NVI98566.1 hypothetical protein [Myxococcus sp. AM009]NVJ15190.1 hypothetical protein [Myxococcus sp. AM010]